MIDENLSQRQKKKKIFFWLLFFFECLSSAMTFNYELIFYISAAI